MPFNPNEHMMDLKGKQYLQVMWRIVWFREEHPEWTIETEILSHDPAEGNAVFKCCIKDPVLDRVISTGHGSESRRDFKDYLEKAETKAIGRALAMLGYGTQFAPELDEEERIVDSPVSMKKSPKEWLAEKAKELPVQQEEQAEPVEYCEDCNNPVQPVKTPKRTYTVAELISNSKEKYGACLCFRCMSARKKGSSVA